MLFLILYDKNIFDHVHRFRHLGSAMATNESKAKREVITRKLREKQPLTPSQLHFVKSVPSLRKIWEENYPAGKKYAAKRPRRKANQLANQAAQAAARKAVVAGRPSKNVRSESASSKSAVTFAFEQGGLDAARKRAKQLGVENS